MKLSALNELYVCLICSFGLRGKQNKFLTVYNVVANKDFATDIAYINVIHLFCIQIFCY